MATSASRVLWKGAISFGLVHIPIALHSAVESESLNFDWLDKRSMDPVGYKRINKKTGREITKENIVKGIEHDKGQYVVLTDEEIAAAYPKTTQTIEIDAFIPADDIPFVHLERPYYIEPVNKGEKVYALLREVLVRSGRIGIARVVIQTKQHLAALVPLGPALVLNLLRWPTEVRDAGVLNLPAEGVKGAGLSERELKMAEQLVGEMSGKWEPKHYRDSFKDQILKLVKQKVDAGQTETVIEPEAAEAVHAGDNVVDLTELLQRSLRGGAKAPAAAEGKRGKPTGKTASAKAAAKPAAKPARKPSGKTAARSTARKSTPGHGEARKAAPAKATVRARRAA